MRLLSSLTRTDALVVVVMDTNARASHLQAGEFLDECVKMGVSSINSIDYFISDQVMRDTQKEALKVCVGSNRIERGMF